MREIEFEPGSAGPPFSLEYVADVQSGVDVQFPAAFLALMAKSNGGVPAPKYFDLDGNTLVVERFLSFVEDYKSDPSGMYDIEVVWSQIEDRLDEMVCPFAALFAGDFLCFDQRAGGEPSVVLWNHEAGDDDDRLVAVAEDFESFLDMLTDAED